MGQGQFIGWIFQSCSETTGEKKKTNEEKKEDNDVISMVGELGWVVERKYDGVAGCLVYENNRLVRVVTRGDGKEGLDVSNTFLSLIPPYFPIEVYDNHTIGG